MAVSFYCGKYGEQEQVWKQYRQMPVAKLKQPILAIQFFIWSTRY